jgi:hypothetical protein
MDVLLRRWEMRSIAATAVDERFQRPPQLGREIFFLDCAEKRNRGRVSLQLRHALWALGQVFFEFSVYFGWQLTLDEIGEKAHEVVTASSVRHRKRQMSSADLHGLCRSACGIRIY